MSHLTIELQRLKAEVKDMWELVINQSETVTQAFFKLDKELGHNAVFTENRVNIYELNIDLDCENIFALYNPVAVDLRYVLAVLKINSNLERIGDNYESIAGFVLQLQKPLAKELLKITRVKEAFEIAEEMLKETLKAFEEEDTLLARRIFKKDELLDQINVAADKIIADYMLNHKDKIEECLYVSSVIKKLERVGDQVTNMAEEIIFHLEAKVLKHKPKPEVVGK